MPSQLAGPAVRETHSAGDLCVNAHPANAETARFVVLGYAFGTRDPAWAAPEGQPVGPVPNAARPANWAYRSYDCVPSDEGPITAFDVLVVNGIDGQISSEQMLAIMAISPLIDETLALAPSSLAFWELPATDVGEAPPRPDAAAWPLWRVWWLLMGVNGCGIAVTHKLLHHKRPRLFPLLDNKTADLLRASQVAPGGTLWQRIHTDLITTSTEWGDLEQWFAQEAALRNGVALARTRLHDILLWCLATGRTEAAARAGWALLEENPSKP